MKVEFKRSQPKVTVTIQLEEWEAADLEKMLNRIKKQPKVSKSDFTIREKSTGRRLLLLLEINRAIMGPVK